MKLQILSGCGVVIAAGLAVGLAAGHVTRATGAGPKGSGVSGEPAPIGPDVIVGSLNGISRWAGDGTRTSYSFGTTSCNIGDVPLQWIDESGSTLYPTIAQHLYRLSPDGRFEQIGQSWLKHGFCALQGTLCSVDCVPYPGGCGDHLGVLCSDPYSSSLNGNQSGLGPKYEVNAYTGEHPNIDVQGYEPPGEIVDAFSRRVVVQDADLDSELNPGALYFTEGHYVTYDDAQAGNQHNNASYRQAGVGAAPTYSLTFVGGTQQQLPAIIAWEVHDPFAGDADPDNDVVLTEIGPAVTSEGRLIVGAQVTELEGGLWHYEYAIYNMSSDRSVRRFTVPVGSGATISNVGFHDVDYHSGEPWDGTDWNGVLAPDGLSITWETSTFAADPNANAIRWGTLYNFRFDSDAAPVDDAAEFEFFKPASIAGITPDVILVDVRVPGAVETPCTGDVDGDGQVAVTDIIAIIIGWGPCGVCPADVNGDGVVDVQDLIAAILNVGVCP